MWHSREYKPFNVSLDGINDMYYSDVFVYFKELVKRWVIK